MLSKVFSISSGLVFLIASSSVMALPNAMTSVFNVSRNGTTLGYLKSTLTYTGNQYHYHKSTKATGLAKLVTKATISEKSEGVFSGNRVIPKTYIYNEKSRNKKRVDKAVFSQGRVEGSYKGKEYNLAVPANVLDRGVLEMVVANDLRRQLPSLNYKIMERGKLRDYQVIRQGTENVATKAGHFEAIKLIVKRLGGSRETIFWVAPKLDFLPVKISHKEKGDTITSILRSYKALEN